MKLLALMLVVVACVGQSLASTQFRRLVDQAQAQRGRHNLALVYTRVIKSCDPPCSGQTGVVDWFNEARGFGFIISDNRGLKVFVHFSAIQGEGFRTLKKGDKVTFTVVAGAKGPEAENVAKV